MLSIRSTRKHLLLDLITAESAQELPPKPKESLQGRATIRSVAGVWLVCGCDWHNHNQSCKHGADSCMLVEDPNTDLIPKKKALYRAKEANAANLHAPIHCPRRMCA